MANEQNLKPNTERTPSERSELARKAGKASGKARRELKTFREYAEKALATIVKAKQDGEVVEMTAKEAIILAQLKKALKGDVKAVELLTKHIGEMPAEHIALEGGLNNTLEVKIIGAEGAETPTADDEQ